MADWSARAPLARARLAFRAPVTDTGVGRAGLGVPSVAVAVVAFVAGCSMLPWTSPTPVPVDPELPVGIQVFQPPTRMRLGASNQTTITVRLEVNGRLARELAPGAVADLVASDLPGPPWVATIRTESGRVLAELTVRAGDVWFRRNKDGSTEMKGDGARVDLSCGRIDLWSGQQMGGPAPGPGSPGDCDP